MAAEADNASDAVVVAADERSIDDAADNPVDVARWKRLAEQCLRAEGVAGELTLTFIDRDEIAELNEQYMGKSGPTDVLSFPLDEPDSTEIPILLGDIVIAPLVAAEQFAEHAGTYDDELALLVVHGVLHILGHDHAEPDETAIMRERELALLGAHHWSGPAPTGFRQVHSE